MAFMAKNFVLCSKFPLFKASSNLWLYSTADTLEDCLADNYFQPRQNLKNQDSPDVGDVIQVLVEYSKLAYLKVVAKTEQPYTITVARTFLENEAVLLSLITELQLEKAAKATDFVTPITDENLGITQTEQAGLEQKIDNAANSGRMITAQGLWYAKMYTETVAPSAEDGTNYADFSQTDGDGNPIIVTYNRVSGAWVQDQTITPPADYDGYVPITSKMWDIVEQDGQQGGRVLWNHTSKEFTPYPTIVSFEDIEITGDSTVVMPQTPSDNNIANVGFVKNTIGAARNIGDIFFTARTEIGLNGSVACDGGTYSTADFSGAQSIGNLLAGGKLPYVSLATYATLLSTKGSVGVFGWDGIGTTAFRVPSLNDIFVETGTAAQIGDFLSAGAPAITGSISGVQYLNTSATGAFSVASQEAHDTGTTHSGGGLATYAFNASSSSAVYGNSNTIQPKSIRYRAMIQLAVATTDDALITCTSVAGQVSANTDDISDLKDMSNITATGKANIIGLMTPDYTSGVAQTFSQGDTLTFNENCYLFVWASNTGNINLKYGDSAGEKIAQFNQGAAQEASCMIFIPAGSSVYVQSFSGNAGITKFSLLS